MESAELTLVVQDDENLRVKRNDGAETGGKLILDDLRRSMIELFEDWLSQGKISRRREIEAFGTLLYRVLFNGQVEGFFEQSLVDARRAGQRLRVQLSFEVNGADLASIPWEYLYYPDAETHAGFFMATHVDLVLSRYMPLAIARKTLAPSQGPLRILIAVSKPQELGPVISEPVIEAIQNFAETYPIQIDILDKPTTDNFLDKLYETKPHVLHFIGHGQFNRAEGKAHGLRNELQRGRKSASQARSILWLGGFPGRSIASVSEDEINTDSQDSKQDDEEQIEEAHRFEGNDNKHQHKTKDQRKQRQDSAYTVQIVGSGCGSAKAPSPEFLAGEIDTVRGQQRQLIAWRIAHLRGRLAARLFFKWRVLLRHSNISRVVKLFFFPLITSDLARSCRGKESLSQKAG